MRKPAGLPFRIASRCRSLLVSLGRRYSPSGLLFSVVALSTLVLGLSAVAASYFGIDVFGSISYVPLDTHCFRGDHATGFGMHCFGDYYQVVEYSQRPNPWANQSSNYSASAMIPNLLFGMIGNLAGAPQLGLVLFLLLTAGAVMVPAIWASAGKPLWMRIVTAGLVGVASVPALVALDRGNTTALAVPALLAFLIALRRGSHTGIVIAIVAAALIRPQFVILIAVLLALRRWKLTGIAVLAVGLSNALAYLLWPQQFPGTIVESIGNVLTFGNAHTLYEQYPPNVSISKGLYEVERVALAAFGQTAGSGVARLTAPAGTLIAMALVVAIVVIGRRLPPHIAGMLLLMTASLSASITFSYYLAFSLPIAAILLRDPNDPRSDSTSWHGVLDEERSSRPRVAATILISLAVATSLTRLLLPPAFVTGVPDSPIPVLSTTAALAPVLWLAATVVSLAAWAQPHTKRSGTTPPRAAPDGSPAE